MGLADRQYMRDEYHPPRFTTILIVVLIVAFLLQSVLIFYFDVNAIRHLGLSVAGIGAWKIWQFFTFQFLHACPWPWHVLFNCIGLYFFGRPVEESLGAKKFLQLYFLSGFAGGLLQVVTTIVLPRHVDVPVVGASAGICGLLAIYCSQHPMQEIRTWVYFFPITIRAYYFLIFISALSLFGTLIPFDGVAHAAHLGGIIIGVGYVRWGEKIGDFFLRYWPKSSRTSRKTDPETEAISRRKSKSMPDEFISKEVDPILEKISQQGLQSLTASERKILDEARKKMEKR